MTEEIYPTDDATVNSIHPDINDGDAKVLSVLRQFREDGSLWRNHTCLRFQLSEPLPTSATLHILCIDYLVHGHNLLLTSSSEDWDEDTITWNNRPEVELQEVIPTDDIIYGWNEITIDPSLYHLGSGVISIVLSLDWSAPWSAPILNNQVAIRSKESSDPPYIKTQPKFKIRAMEDVSTAISGATVTVTGIGTKTTDNNGYTSWFYADYDTYLDVHITADGYEYYNAGDYFNEGEDGMVWTHYLVPEVVPYLNVTPLSHNSPAAGESFPITVESNISWDAEDDVSWVSLSPTYGSDNGIITATVDENPGITSRTWHVTVAGEGASRTRTYTQSGADILPAEFEFINPDTQGYLFWDSEKCFAEESKTIPKDTVINVHAQVQNVGGTEGRAYLQVFKTPLMPVSLCLKNSGATLIQPGATHTFSEYCFNMDDVNMEIELQTYALGQTTPDHLGCNKIRRK